MYFSLFYMENQQPRRMFDQWNSLTWNLVLQILQALLPHKAPLSSSISAPVWETLLYRLTNCRKDIELLFQTYHKFLPSLKVQSIDFQTICQTRLFGDVLQMDLHHRKLGERFDLWFCNTPLFSPTLQDTIQIRRNFLRKR